MHSAGVHGGPEFAGVRGGTLSGRLGFSESGLRTKHSRTLAGVGGVDELAEGRGAALIDAMVLFVRPTSS